MCFFRRRPLALLMTVVAVFTTGCDLPSPADPAPEQPDAAESPAGSNAEITLAIKSWDEIQQWVQDQRGQVVVIDLWSTSCGPCIREFPHFVALHQSHPHELSCASLSLDFYGGGTRPEDSEPAVRKFLQSKAATMVNFLCSDPDQHVLEKVGANMVPVALVYDRQGTLHTVFHNDDERFDKSGFNYDDHVVPLVESLLANKDS